MSYLTAYINGQFIEERNATLHVNDLAVSRGYGVFDFFRTINHIPLFLEHHLDRFFHSASAMRLKLGVTREELKSIIHHLIKTNTIAESGIRILLTGGYSSNTLEILTPNLIITQQPLPAPPPPASVKNGIKVITHEYLREMPDIKTTHYMMAVWLQEKIKQSDAADVLYHQNGVLSEFPRANFFMVTRDNVLVTPEKNILGGITRMKILELARVNFSVAERMVTREDIRNAKEAFMTSTTRRILPITRVDDIIIGNGSPGPVTNFLEKAFAKMEMEWTN